MDKDIKKMQQQILESLDDSVIPPMSAQLREKAAMKIQKRKPWFKTPIFFATSSLVLASGIAVAIIIPVNLANNSISYEAMSTDEESIYSLSTLATTMNVIDYDEGEVNSSTLTNLLSINTLDSSDVSYNFSDRTEGFITKSIHPIFLSSQPLLSENYEGLATPTIEGDTYKISYSGCEVSYKKQSHSDGLTHQMEGTLTRGDVEYELNGTLTYGHKNKHDFSSVIILTTDDESAYSYQLVENLKTERDRVERTITSERINTESTYSMTVKHVKTRHNNYVEARLVNDLGLREGPFTFTQKEEKVYSAKVEIPREMQLYIVSNDDHYAYYEDQISGEGYKIYK